MKKPLLIFSILVSVHANAQTDLDPVTVTASLSQSKVSSSGRDILVLKGETFRQYPIHSIDELLRYVPGIEIQQRGPQGAQSDILIRGGTFQQVLVIIDGIRLNDPLTGHFNSYIPVTPAEIDRIEVMKGSSSAIYGSDAVGGVIHIITKNFSESEQKNSLSGGFTAGENGLLNINAGGYHKKRNVGISGGILSNNSTGQPQRGIRGYFHNTTVSGSARFNFRNWKIGMQTSFDRRNFAAQNFYTAFTSDTATEKVNTWWNHLKANYSKGKNGFSVDAGYKTMEDEYFFNRQALPNENRSSLFQSQAVYTRQLSAATKLTAGSQFINRSIRSNDRGNHSVSAAAVFLILNQQLGRNFYINPALRLEKELIPQLSLALRLDKFLLRASGGKTVRDADFTERYNNYGKALVSSGNIGNPGLAAESSWSFEGGADYHAVAGVKFSFSVFSKFYSNLIDWVNTPYNQMPRKENLTPGGNYFLGKNISKLTTSGVEISSQYHSRSFDGMAGISVINSSATPSLYISSHANLLFTWSLAYRIKFFEFAVNGLYKQRALQAGNAALAELTEEYVVFNARLSARMGKANVFLNADNLGDRNYADRFGVPMPGRWLSAGVNVWLKEREREEN